MIDFLSIVVSSTCLERYSYADCTDSRTISVIILGFEPKVGMSTNGIECENRIHNSSRLASPLHRQ